MVPPYSHRVSRVRRYSGFLLCNICFRLRDFHSVSSAFPYRSTSFFARCVSPNPEKLSPSVWPLPRSLATTCGISVDFSSSSYLDVSVQTVPRVRLFYSTHADRFFTCRVAPFGYPRIDAYVPLPVAFRSLSRPSSAPDAKASSLRPSSLDLRRRGLRLIRFLAPAFAFPQKLICFAAPPLPREPSSLGFARLL